MRTGPRARLAAALLAVGLAACAGPPDSPTGAPAADAPASTAVAPSPGAASPPPAPEPEAIAELRRPWYGDLDGMVARRVVRVLVTFNRTAYFLDQGRPRGITSELLQAFEDELNRSLGSGHLRVQVVAIPVRRDELLPALVAGVGDIAAAGLTATAERRDEVDFAAPLAERVRQLLVTAPGAAPVATLDDLSGREIFVRPSSAFAQRLRAVSDDLERRGRAAIRIAAADERLEDEDLIEMVHAGLLPATVVDDHLALIWKQVFPDLEVHETPAIATGGEIAWAIRKGSPRLLAAASDFARGHRKGTLFGNVVFRRYLVDGATLKNAGAEEDLARLRRLAELFRRHAATYDFDWLMVAAQGYQESRLDQSLRSRAGAIGIMQLLPTTAADKAVGIPDISTADRNIEAGVRYLRFLTDRYFAEPGISRLDRELFAFAAYNAGPARVAGLRRQAVAMGLDPDRWFENVEIVAAREIGRETVQYVRNIFKYYVAYRRVFELDAARRAARAGATS